MGKSQVEKVEQGFDLLQDSKEEDKKTVQNEDKGDVYNLLGALKIPYSVKKSRTGKVSISLNLTSKEQLNVLLNNLQKVQNTLNDGEYVVVPIAQKVPYTLTLVITKDSSILKIAYLSGYIKNVNMSIPVSQGTINALHAIVSALMTSEMGKILLSISTLSNTSQNSENLL